MAKPKRVKSAWLRAGAQVVGVGLFIYLGLAARLGWWSPLPYDLFLRLDPLVWMASSVAARGLAPYGWMALGLVIVTAVFGRVFCGWVCPLGGLIDAVGIARGSRRGVPLAKRLSLVRFGLLLALVGAAAAGANLVGWFDPLVMSARALHVSRGMHMDGAGAAIAWLLVATALALTLVAPRLWCRIACPLGALLSLIARVAPYQRRVGDSCTECAACATACPMGHSDADHTVADCIGCRRCQAACAEQAIAFSFSLRSPSTHEELHHQRSISRSRRAFLLGSASLVIGGVASLIIRPRSGRVPLRPPGAQDEAELATRCVGCGTCLAVCPTGGLLPLVSARRLNAVFTPKLVPSVGACLPGCTACGDACPTGAIARIEAEDKAKIQIGLAVIDRSRCLPWAKHERCLVCEDNCPDDYAAIEMRLKRAGELVPYVKRGLCTGCGICEHECPEAAIRVVAVNDIGGTWKFRGHQTK